MILYQKRYNLSVPYRDTNTHIIQHFFMRIINIPQKIAGLMTYFLPSNTLQRIKINRKPQKSQENHYLCIQQAFCNIHTEIPYRSIHCI